MSGWLVNPWLFGLGALLVAAPIIIHLLNKRKFRIIDWAAMDFLIEADQRNRRRIQLEELLLLALRCLAVLLTGLLVARPFLPSSLFRGWFQSVRTERIVVLDDSPSMAASDAGGTPIGDAQTQLADFVTELAQRGAGDSFTLVLTSRPARPLLTDVPINSQTATDVLNEIESLAPSDMSSRLEAACVEVRGLLGGRSDKINRVVYLLTDLRRTDWIAADRNVERNSFRSANPDSGNEEQHESRSTADAVLKAVRELATESAGCFVVDVGNDAIANLSVVEIAPEDKALLAGVTARFNVTVRNHGAQTVRDVPLRFIAGGSLPLTATLESVPAGGTSSVPFSHAFAPYDPTAGEAPPEPVEMRAELGESAGADVLAADNVGFYAARVRPGIPTLVVDGDPSTEFGQAETFFLQRALAPPGLVNSGIQIEVIGDTEFETRSLAPYQVVYVCNVYHLSEQRRRSLEEWVAAGGGLVLWPGGQVDERHYNEELYRNGGGLLPLRLDRVAGDESEQTWASLSVEQPEHPCVRIFTGDAAPLLQGAKVFQWWVGEGGTESGVRSQESADVSSSPATTVLRLTDAERSPVLVDRPFGRGRVVQINVPADAEWSNWPEDANYLILLQELNRYLAQTAADRGGLIVGEPLRQPLDVSQYRAEALITRPDGATVTRQAVSFLGETGENTGNIGDGPTGWVVKYDETDQRGFYGLQLTRTDGGSEPVLFAANLSPDEGNLQRMDAAVLTRAWDGVPVQLVRDAELASLTAEGAKGELWFRILLALMAVLFVEQTLAWWFGRSR
jgi:hypothetical protein